MRVNSPGPAAARGSERGQGHRRRQFNGTRGASGVESEAAAGAAGETVRWFPEGPLLWAGPATGGGGRRSEGRRSHGGTRPELHGEVAGPLETLEGRGSRTGGLAAFDSRWAGTGAERALLKNLVNSLSPAARHRRRGADRRSGRRPGAEELEKSSAGARRARERGRAGAPGIGQSRRPGAWRREAYGGSVSGGRGAGNWVRLVGDAGRLSKHACKLAGFSGSGGGGRRRERGGGRGGRRRRWGRGGGVLEHAGELAGFVGWGRRGGLRHRGRRGLCRRGRRGCLCRGGGLRRGIVPEEAREFAGFLGWGWRWREGRRWRRRRGGLDRGWGWRRRRGGLDGGWGRRWREGRGRRWRGGLDGGWGRRWREGRRRWRGGLDGRWGRGWREGRRWRWRRGGRDWGWGEAGSLAGVEQEGEFSGFDLRGRGGGQRRRRRRRGGLSGELPGPIVEGGEALDDGGDGVRWLVRVLDFEQLAAAGGGTRVQQRAELEQQGRLSAPGSWTPQMQEDLLAGRHLAGEEGLGLAVEDEFDQFVALIEAHV